jgi:DNA-directed RNA polymerase subunit E'/Rpb7
MATKDKNGKWIWDDEEEREIEMGKEVRVRTHNEIRAQERAEKIKQDCAEGKHVVEAGKCKHCGVDVKPEKPASKRFSLVR